MKKLKRFGDSRSILYNCTFCGKAIESIKKYDLTNKHKDQPYCPICVINHVSHKTILVDDVE